MHMYTHSVHEYITALSIGQTAMKHYLPMKPIKSGMKVWVVAESNTGYFLDLQVYMGKEGGGTECCAQFD